MSQCPGSNKNTALATVTSHSKLESRIPLISQMIHKQIHGDARSYSK